MKQLKSRFVKYLVHLSPTRTQTFCSILVAQVSIPAMKRCPYLLDYFGTYFSKVLSGPTTACLKFVVVLRGPHLAANLCCGRIRVPLSRTRRPHRLLWSSWTSEACKRYKLNIPKLAPHRPSPAAIRITCPAPRQWVDTALPLPETWLAVVAHRLYPLVVPVCPVARHRFYDPSLSPPTTVCLAPFPT